MRNDFKTLEQKIRQIMMSETAQSDDINEDTFEVKYAERKKGPIKVNKFKNLEDAKEFLSTVRAAGSNGIISKNGKPVKEEVEHDMEETLREDNLVGTYVYQNNAGRYVKLRITKNKDGSYAAMYSDGSGGKKLTAASIRQQTKGMMKEETQVDELKKSTMRSYIDKANYQALTKSQQAEYGKELASAWRGSSKAKKDKLAKKTSNAEADRLEKRAKKDQKKAAKRYKGISLAARKLAREETQIDELKKSTLSKYAQKAFTQHNNRFGIAAVGQVRGQEEHPDDARVRRNRKKGVQRAIAKMGDDKYGKKKVKEETQIDEKAVSQQQQKLMGMAYAYKTGELENASETVKKIASSMSTKELRDFASTKHKGLPEGAMSKDKEKHDTGGFRISNADAKAARDRLAAKRKQKTQKSAIAISKKKLKKMNTEETDKDSISNKKLKSVGKGKKDKIKINPKMQNDKEIDNTSEEM